MKLKIGLYCPYNYYRHGGVQETIAAHQEHLSKLGHDVWVITPEPEKTYLKRSGNIKHLGTSKEYSRLFDTKADVAKASDETVERFLADNQFDIINLHEPGVPHIGPKILKAKNKPLVVGTFHARLPDGLSYKIISQVVIKPYYRWLKKRLDWIVAASPTAARHVENMTNNKVDIISNGIEIDKYSLPKKPTKQNDKPTILYINRLEKRKGPDLLLKAYKQLLKRSEDVALIIASDGGMRQELEQYVRENMLDDVEFIGFIEEEDKINLLNSCDLYCAPSPYGEGFGIVLLEAMAAGIPYLAGDNEGYRNTTASMQESLLVDPYDIESFADKLENLLFDKQLRRDYSHWSSEYVQQFDYKDIIKKYDNLYKLLIKDKQ